ncbi:MAG: SRPBCC family protein [Actinomycetota bacterium]
MPESRPMRAVGADYATTGPNTTTLVQSVARPAADLFRCLEDGPAWKEWLGIDVEWTSEPPFGVGTTRTVTRGRARIDEEFVAWEDGRRMNFYFTDSTLPVAAFAEDYLIEPDGDDGCTLHWSYAYEWAGPLGGLGARAFGLVFKRQGTSSLRRLAALLEADPGRFDA